MDKNDGKRRRESSVRDREFLSFVRMGLLVGLLVLGTTPICMGLEIDAKEGIAVVRDISASENNLSNTSSPDFLNTQYGYMVPPRELWTCFDHSMNYSHHNPEWGMLLISKHPRFMGLGEDISHFVNYQISSEGVLSIYDGCSGNHIWVFGWEDDVCTHDYYHFYIDGEKPTRYYNFQNQFQIRPNAELVYDRVCEVV